MTRISGTYPHFLGIADKKSCNGSTRHPVYRVVKVPKGRLCLCHWYLLLWHPMVPQVLKYINDFYFNNNCKTRLGDFYDRRLSNTILMLLSILLHPTLSWTKPSSILDYSKIKVKISLDRISYTVIRCSYETLPEFCLLYITLNDFKRYSKKWGDIEID